MLHKLQRPTGLAALTRLAGLALVSLGAACASSPPAHPTLATESEPAATVLLIRAAGGPRANTPIQMLLDGEAVSAMRAARWTRLRIQPGSHLFEPAASDDPEKRPGFQSAAPGQVIEASGTGSAKAVRLELAAGETQFVVLRYDRTDRTLSRAGQRMVEETRVLFAAEQVAESTGRKLMREYDEVQVEHP